VSDALLAALPSGGMTRRKPEDCQELLRLCTVMGWAPRLPLEIMRDDDAGRWFMRGQKGKQDYWMRDADIEVLKGTPMWDAVRTASPYGAVQAMPKPLTPKPLTMIYDEPPKDDEPEADPVEQDKLDRSQERLAAEERFHKWDDWE